MPLLRKIPSLFSVHTPNFLADTKSNERVFRAMEKVIRLCQDDRIQLKNSPPYILEILPELYPLLQTAIKQVLHELSSYISLSDKNFLHNTSNADMPVFLPEYFTHLWDKYKIPENLANSAIYLKLFLTNVYLKCRDIVQLFKEDEGLSELSDARSKTRLKLSHISLILSNMWKEFEAMFNVSVQQDSSVFTGSEFKVTKQEGNTFWQHHFPKQCIVHWSHFVRVFTSAKNEFEIMSSEESLRLRETFDITENGYVSVFEFDIFVRLFHPFRNLIKNWLQITSHPAHMGFKTYDEVCAILGKHKSRPGSYVFRVSCTKLGQWSIGYVDGHGKILQTIPSTPTLIEALNRGVEDRYYLYPNGEDFNPDLKAEGVVEVEQLVVSEEEQQIYHLMDSTYEECKLCYERQKDTKIEPCGHLICRQCLEQIRKQTKAECPWCRQDIRGNVNINIQPKDKPAKSEQLPATSYELPTYKPEKKQIQSNSKNLGGGTLSDFDNPFERSTSTMGASTFAAGVADYNGSYASETLPAGASSSGVGVYGNYGAYGTNEFMANRPPQPLPHVPLATSSRSHSSSERKPRSDTLSSKSSSGRRHRKVGQRPQSSNGSSNDFVYNTALVVALPEPEYGATFDQNRPLSDHEDPPPPYTESPEQESSSNPFSTEYINLGLDSVANEDSPTSENDSAAQNGNFLRANESLNLRKSDTAIAGQGRDGAAAIIGASSGGQTEFLGNSNGVSEGALSNSYPALSVCNPIYSSFT